MLLLPLHTKLHAYQKQYNENHQMSKQTGLPPLDSLVDSLLSNYCYRTRTNLSIRLWSWRDESWNEQLERKKSNNESRITQANSLNTPTVLQTQDVCKFKPSMKGPNYQPLLHCQNLRPVLFLTWSCPGLHLALQPTVKPSFLISYYIGI